MPETPRISEAEWQVMRVVWERHPVTAQEVADRLAEVQEWSDRTVRTLLGRLVRKGALGFEEEGRRYRYHPLVSERECVAAESRSFLARVFGGSATPLLAHFVKESELSEDEVRCLHALLDEKARRGGGK